MAYFIADVLLLNMLESYVIYLLCDYFATKKINFKKNIIVLLITSFITACIQLFVSSLKIDSVVITMIVVFLSPIFGSFVVYKPIYSKFYTKISFSKSAFLTLLYFMSTIIILKVVNMVFVGINIFPSYYNDIIYYIFLNVLIKAVQLAIIYIFHIGVVKYNGYIENVSRHNKHKRGTAIHLGKRVPAKKKGLIK